MSDALRDGVLNEVRSRRRNEWIEATNASFGQLRAMESYVCECSYDGCPATITLSHDEYEGVRRHATHFAIAINHEDPEIDRVVGENERYATAEKWLGESNRIAEATDPRRGQAVDGPLEAEATE